MSKDKTPQNLLERFEDTTRTLTTIRSEIAKVIFGQDTVIDQTLTTILSGGHALLVGLPGLGKTLLAQTVAQTLGLSDARVQCTPDLMPSDILGSEILDTDEHGKRTFRFAKGPVFSQILLVDEINRASPRTQSALLQAMQERTVSAAGKTHDLPAPFHVLATQNPIEHEGTYPLPEAQLDRFFMQIDVGYPDAQAERKMAISTTTGQSVTPTKMIDAQALSDMQDFVRMMPIGESVTDMIIQLVRALRPDEHAAPDVQTYVEWAPGPRAAQALMLAVRAKALLEGREAPSGDDVIALALPVFKHRMALNYKAQSDHVGIADLIQGIADTL